ncbi:MAG TPA: glycosyltransferase family 39 protein [Anaerolineaceae bacterium]|mgnify:FL=1|nr:glycosyltransferase family 39 protein [Anaerolineaceae bacterium]HQH84126.1 glycosyltransferase family 39 protein [Anaerolineaceae bacterium]
MDTAPAESTPIETPSVQPPRRRLTLPRDPALWLLLVAVLIYLVTRFIGLDRFPIYFFTDEAVQTILADDFLDQGLKSYFDEVLPTYFVNGGQYNLGTSVYLQVLAAWLPRSVWVTRGVSIIVSLLAALGIGLSLRNIFKDRFAWTGVLLLTITPIWFLHSRTAFEVVEATAFYAGFAYCYLMYRHVNPRYLLAAAVLAGLMFYSYSPAQLVLVTTLVLLFFSDLRYHCQNRKYVLISIGIGAVCTIPYIRFLINHPNENRRHLEILHSYWIQSIPFSEKLDIYLREYRRGINPFYWFAPNPPDLVRHVMKGYGHLWLPTLPLLVIGLWQAIKKFKQSAYRTVLMMLVAAPTGGALAQSTALRALFYVIPAVLLMALGLNWLLAKLARPRWAYVLVTVLIFALLAGSSFYMLNDSLTNGPLWFDDYGMGGMQYGGEQLFSAVAEYQAENPGLKLTVTPIWANGTDVIARFFAGDPLPFEMGSVVGHIDYKLPLDDTLAFVVVPQEYKQLYESGKFAEIQVDRTLYYPNGEPGFYFIRLRYADNVDAVFEAEAAARRALVTDTVEIEGQRVAVQHSRLDMGSIQALFDGDTVSVSRGETANPLQVILDFADPRPLSGVTLTVGGQPTRATVTAMVKGLPEPVTFTGEVQFSPETQVIDLPFEVRLPVSRLTIEILSLNDVEPTHVHVWEIALR